ncbi:hypothetical protein BU16DRAFT_570144 [Lophium mytilinum]|uniref:Protein YOP1 n=1 Tax=Lophium mytilinum TaxID=390894 RepID=A0A6A6R864_9PEZI|nr:hypothetical protein BU16DRAFT_570144 [Lophium mytilinum]
MFDFIADGLNTTITILFPIFASYKALHSSDPALLAPWLMYFVTLTLAHLLESTFAFILDWVPFYAWFRLFAHLYLVLPGSQGASFLYQTHIDPFLRDHERAIDDFITSAHERAKSAGFTYLKLAIEWAKVNVLGLPPQAPEPEPRRGVSYAQSLMGRFNMPSARADTDFYGLISQTLSGATAGFGGTTREAQAEELSASGNLVPPGLDEEQRASYLATQRNRLMVLLQAFDREQGSLAEERESRDGGYRGLAKSRSEVEFDRIERDEVEREGLGGRPEAGYRRVSGQPGGWMPWNWAGKKPVEPEDLAYGDVHAQKPSSREGGRSSGYDGARSSGYDGGRPSSGFLHS